MKLISIEKDGKMFMFVCESRNTRNGFAHDCTLFINGIEQGKQSCYYLNRTWEMYTYQSVMIDSINAMIYNRESNIKRDYKTENNVSRMTKNHKSKLLSIINADPVIAMYQNVKRELQSKCF